MSNFADDLINEIKEAINEPIYLAIYNGYKEVVSATPDYTGQMRASWTVGTSPTQYETKNAPPHHHKGNDLFRARLSKNGARAKRFLSRRDFTDKNSKNVMISNTIEYAALRDSEHNITAAGAAVIKYGLSYD
jgi:hypothetical protein